MFLDTILCMHSAYKLSACIYVLSALMKVLKNLATLMVSYLHKELILPIFNMIGSY